MQFKNTRAFSDVQDKADHLYMFRKEFLIPKGIYIQEQLDNWENLAVEG